MKRVKLFEQFVNESSTLSSIGATPAQVKKAHTTGEALLHDNQYEKVTRKADINAILKADRNWYHKFNTVIAFDNDGNMTIVTIKSVRTIDPNGKLIANYYNLSRSEIVKYIPKGDYYVAKDGSLSRDPKSHDRAKEEQRIREVRSIISEVTSNLDKFISREYKELESEIRTKIKAAVDSGDYESVDNMLSLISSGDRFSGGRKLKTPSQVITYTNQSISSAAYDRVISDLKTKGVYYNVVNMSDKEIKKFAYETAVKYIKDLRNKLKM